MSAQEHFERALARPSDDMAGVIADYDEAIRLKPNSAGDKSDATPLSITFTSVNDPIDLGTPRTLRTVLGVPNSSTAKARALHPSVSGPLGRDGNTRLKSVEVGDSELVREWFLDAGD